MGLAELRADNEQQPTTGVAALRAENERPPLTTAQKIVRGAAASTIGGAVGGASGAILGSVVPGVGTAAGALTGTMLGSAAGEAVTQFFDPFKAGVTEPSLSQIGLAGILPIVPTLARRFFLSMPGAASGLQEFLFKRLGDKGERVVAQFAPVAGTADGLFKQARAAGTSVRVAMPSTTQVAQQISGEVTASKFATGSAKAIAARAKAFAAQGAVSFEDFRLNQSDVGALIRSLERKGGAALGRAKQLYAAMWDDLDLALLTREVTRRPLLALPPAGGSTVTGPSRLFAGRPLTAGESASRTLEAAEALVTGTPFREAAGSILDVVPGMAASTTQRLGPTVPQVIGPTAQAVTARVGPTQDLLRQAIDAFKREEAAKFVKDSWLKSIVRRVGQTNFDADVFLTKIDRGRDVLSRLMPSSEIDDIIATIRAPLAPGAPAATKIATAAKTPRLGFEQVPFAERAVVSGALGGVIGAAAGGPMGAGLGAGTSILAVEAISSAMTTAPGRAFIKMLAGRGMAWNQIGNLLLQGGRTAMTPDTEARVNAGP